MLVAVFTSYDSLEHFPVPVGASVTITRVDYGLFLDMAKNPVRPVFIETRSLECVVGRSGTSLAYMDHDSVLKKDVERVVSIRYELGRPQKSKWQTNDKCLHYSGSIYVVTEDADKAEAQARQWIKEAQEELGEACLVVTFPDAADFH